MTHPLSHELAVATRLAREAAAKVLAAYGYSHKVVEKPNNLGPVTEVDQMLNDFFLQSLAREFPSATFVGEESEDDLARKTAVWAWVIDPLDGTREFLNKTGDFSCVLGLMNNGKPVLGVICQPTTGVLWYAVQGQGAFRVDATGTTQISVSRRKCPELRMAVPRTFREGRRSRLGRQYLGISTFLPRGSAGLKFAMIAEGEADVYLHLTNQLGLWDTCAAEVLVTEAGGKVSQLDGSPLDYRGSSRQHEHGVFACNAAAAEDLMQRMQVAASQGVF